MFKSQTFVDHKFMAASKCNTFVTPNITHFTFHLYFTSHVYVAINLRQKLYVYPSPFFNQCTPLLFFSLVFVAISLWQNYTWTTPNRVQIIYQQSIVLIFFYSFNYLLFFLRHTFNRGVQIYIKHINSYTWLTRTILHINCLSIWD